MLFNSFPFLGGFLVFAVVWYLIFPRARRLLIIAGSLYFYATFQISYVLLLVGAALVAYLAGRGMAVTKSRGQRKAILVIGVLVELTALIVFKYLNLLSTSLAHVFSQLGLAGAAISFPYLQLVVPAGLSFFSFSCVSYLADVYRGALPAESDLGKLCTYVFFFPKLLAGPIERATTFLPQLKRPLRFEPEGVSAGMQLFLWGLFKKVVIADRLGAYVDTVYPHPQFASPVQLVLATYFFAFQIYCDFSGYSDMAIGIARVLGFNLMENFRRPYLSTSIPEFWSSRWHISLSRWFRDYLYIPMGGNRVSRPRYYFNQFAVFAVSGLWHGANWTFLIWGALNGIYQVLTLLTNGPRVAALKALHVPRWLTSFLGGLITFHLVLISWVFFRANSLADAMTVLNRIKNALPVLPALFKYYNYTSEVKLSIALVVVLFVVEFIDERRHVWERLHEKPIYVRWVVYYVLLAALAVIGVWGLRRFVYMQF